jgi:hypothetical protein
VKVRTHLRQNAVAICVDDLEAQFVIGVGFSSMIGELKRKRDSELRGKLLAPNDRYATSEDEGLPLRYLSGVAE